MLLEVHVRWRSHLHLSHLVTVFYKSVSSSSSSQLKYFSTNVNCMPSTTANDFYELKLVAISPLMQEMPLLYFVFVSSRFGG